VSGNTATGEGATYGGGGVYVATTRTFRIVAGTIHGSDAGDQNLANTITATGSGAALFAADGATAQHGTFTGTNGAWVSAGNLTSTNATITVVDGVM